MVRAVAIDYVADDVDRRLVACEISQYWPVRCARSGEEPSLKFRREEQDSLDNCSVPVAAAFLAVL
jgi:hypothetical protein